MADTVLDSRGVFANVSIVGMDDGKLVFRFVDGRNLSRSLLDVREVTLSTGADPAADELTRGEALLKQKRYEQALALYERARRAGEKEWLRTFATYRMIAVNDALGRFGGAVSAYLSLVEKHPTLILPAVPRNYPTAGTPEAAALMKDLDQREKAAQTDAMRRAIQRVRDVMSGAVDESEKTARKNAPRSATRPESKSPAPDNAGQKPDPDRADAANDGIAPPPDQSAGSKASVRDKPGENARPASKRKTQPKAARPTASIYRSLDAGKLDEAKAELERGMAKVLPDAPSSRDVWWLAESEYELAAGHADRAGVAAMKVVAVMPDSPYYAEALFAAGRAYETLRPEKARNLYEECLKSPRCDEDLKAQAALRLAALAKAQASRQATP